MPRTLVLLSSLAAMVGCAGPMVERLHVTSTHRFDPAERRAVWGRAVTSFQIAGAFVDLSDPVGGVLRSKVQPSSVQCSNGVFYPSEPRQCSAYQVSQFTVSDDGTAFLRIGRAIWGRGYPGKTLLSADDEKAIQKECEDILLFIMGKSPVPPEPSSPTHPSNLPPPGLLLSI